MGIQEPTFLSQFQDRRIGGYRDNKRIPDSTFTRGFAPVRDLAFIALRNGGTGDISATGSY